MTFLAELVISVLLVGAGIFGLVGSLGLIKLPDTITRLHAPTKATTLGIGGVLIASMLNFLIFDGTLSFHELMISIFMFLTAPITAHFIAKAWLHRFSSPSDLPPTGTASGWAGFEPPEGDEKTAAGEAP